MIACEQFRTLAGALLEGETHPEAHAHLEACPRCRALVDDLGAIARAARALPEAAPPARLWARVRDAAEQEGLIAAPGSWWSRPAPWLDLLAPRTAFAGGLAAAAALALLIFSAPANEFPSTEVFPGTIYEVARVELVSEASYPARYALHLKDVQDTVMAEAPADAEFRRLLDRPLTTMNQAIDETQQHLTYHPDDAMAREALHRLYRQKAAVLQTASDPAWLELVASAR